MASIFKQYFEKEVLNPVFTDHDNNDNATIADCKYLVEIAISRATTRVYKYVDAENKKDRTFIGRIFSFLKSK
jgi:hypothetical protein